MSLIHLCVTSARNVIFHSNCFEKRVKQKRKGKGNRSIMKQRMSIISGYIIALDYRNCIKGTRIATSLINVCFCFACLFPFMIGEADTCLVLDVKPSLVISQ